MNGWTFMRVIEKYKKCPKCGTSYKTNNLYSSLKNEVITIGCKCGWEIKVDKNNKEVR